MIYLKPYNESLNLSLPASSINIKSSFDPDDIIDASEMDDIKVSEAIGQHYRTFIDSNGNSISYFNDKNVDQNIFIKHKVLFLIDIFNTSNPVSDVDCLFRQPISTSELESFVNLTKVTVEKFEKVCKRIASLHDSKMELKVNIHDSNRENTRNIQLRFYLTIIEKDTIDIKGFYNNWKKSSIAKNVDIAIKQLSDMYKRDGMKDPPIDINEYELSDDNSNIVTIGFFTDDEIIDVGIIYKETGNLKVNQRQYLKSFL